nr:X protein [Bat hepatitis virus]
MAARLRCQLDASGNVVLLRPLCIESGGRPVARYARHSRRAAASPVPTVHGPHVTLRRLPICAASPAGPCALRFTCANFSGCMETTMNFVTWLGTRRRTGAKLNSGHWDMYFRESLMKEWEEKGNDQRLYTYVSGGCRHKLLCTL